MDKIIAVLAVVSTALCLIEPFFKKMKMVLIISSLVNALVGISYLLTDSYSGAMICAAAIVCLSINYFITSRDKAIPLWAIVLESMIFLAANVVTFRHLYDVLAVIASLLFVLSIAQKTTKYYRLVYIANTLIWIPYDILAKSKGNLFTHVILAIAIIASIIVRDVKKQKAE